MDESYVEPSPYAWLRSRAPVPTTYAPACEPLYRFHENLENRTSRTRGIARSCTEVAERKYLICIEIWQVEMEGCDWRVSFHKYGYVHGDPIQGIDPTGEFLGFALGIGGMIMTAAFSGGLRSEANKIYFQIFGDVSAEANHHFGGYWRTIQLFSLAGGVGIAGVLGGRGMFQLLRSNGMLPSIQRGLAKMLPFLAKRATDFLERGIVLASSEVFERLSSGGQLAVREAYALRATLPNSRRNVAAMSYSIRDKAGNWVSQKPIADWSVGDVRTGVDSLHSEQVLLQFFQNESHARRSITVLLFWLIRRKSKEVTWNSFTSVLIQDLAHVLPL
jgi:hypothetical protein